MPCGFGSIHAQICAPDGKTLLNGARVTVDTDDCEGAPLHRETVSLADGSFTLTGVPAGLVTVTARLGDFTRTLAAQVTADQVTTLLPQSFCLEQQGLKIAVVTGNGDKIERLLTDLHLRFTTFDGTAGQWANQAGPFLADLARLKTFDLVFIDCDAASIGGYRIDPGADGTQIAENLHAFVQSGGSLYGSDWAALLVGLGVPGALQLAVDVSGPVTFPFDAHHLGGFAPQTVTATIADEGLRTFVGKSEIPVRFPKQTNAVSVHWGLLDRAIGATVLASADAVKTCTDSACDTAAPTSRNAVPLAVKVKVTGPESHGGWVVYTSFHNIAQPGDDVAQMLKYLVLNL
jgi:hypothetical protein